MNSLSLPLTNKDEIPQFALTVIDFYSLRFKSQVNIPDEFYFIKDDKFESIVPIKHLNDMYYNLATMVTCGVEAKKRNYTQAVLCLEIVSRDVPKDQEQYIIANFDTER